MIGQILQSYTELIANPVAYADPAKAHAMHQLRTLLQGTLEARGKVLVKLNVAEPDLAEVIALLPSLKSPTVSQLFGEGGYAVETVVPKSEINTLIPALSRTRAPPTSSSCRSPRSSTDPWRCRPSARGRVRWWRSTTSRAGAPCARPTAASASSTAPASPTAAATSTWAST